MYQSLGIYSKLFPPTKITQIHMYLISGKKKYDGTYTYIERCTKQLKQQTFTELSTVVTYDPEQIFKKSRRQWLFPFRVDFDRDINYYQCSAAAAAAAAETKRASDFFQGVNLHYQSLASSHHNLCRVITIHPEYIIDKFRCQSLSTF